MLSITRRHRITWLSACLAMLQLAACGRGGDAPGATGDRTPDVVPRTASPAGPATAEQIKAAADFYKGRTIRIIVGSGAGGGFDLTARLVSRHLPKHIPNSPMVIVENMPGGGGLVAANHVFHAAAKDGLVIGIFHEGQVMNQLTRAEGVQFDMRDFNWLGSSYNDPNVCIVRSDAPVTTFKELIGSPTALKVGGTGPGSNSYDVPRIVAAATGANLKAVAGYPTTNDVRIGIERGELQGLCFGWESVQSTAAQWLRDRYVRVIVQNGLERHKDLPDVPLAVEFARDEDSRRMLRVLDAPAAMAKPFAMPPGVDAGRVALLRRAFQETYRDPEFLAEANAMHLHFQPNTPPQIQQIRTEVLSSPPDLAAKYKQAIAP
jgi:tripartite-type tricarboxylate transporter receptor subunit TctC